MVDLGGPRIPGWTPPGNVSGGSGNGARTSLQPGVRIEVRVLDVLPDRSVRLRLEPAAARGLAPAAPRAAPPAPVVTAQLAGALPEPLLNRAGAGGTAMLAEITRTEPRLEVRLMPLAPDRAVPRPAGPPTNPVQQWLGQELRHQLPGARPLGPTLQGLLTPPAGAPRGEATPNLAAATLGAPAFQRLVEILPTPGQLTQPDSLRQHVQNSGLWMEAMLGLAGRGQPPTNALAADLKGQLFRAADQLRQGPEPRAFVQPPAPGATASSPALPALTGLLEGLLKRVTSLQLQSLQSFASDEPGNNRWFFELPLRSEQGIHSIHGEIQREPTTDEAGDEAPWSIVLRLDLGDLGPTRVAVASHHGGVSVHFTASEPDTVTRLRSEMAYLRDRFAERELTVTGLSVRQGTVDTDPRPANAHRMVDEQA
ncbi:flagellar hook-length control protein FliK [Thioalkalivibrio sp.]|uniref:flagellar hook-length control protein FliK n=1 Tax=Thioalkalivibrio sp. TaxID=2093813 RepID=UPI00356342AB